MTVKIQFIHLQRHHRANCSHTCHACTSVSDNRDMSYHIQSSSLHFPTYQMLPLHHETAQCFFHQCYQLHPGGVFSQPVMITKLFHYLQVFIILSVERCSPTIRRNFNFKLVMGNMHVLQYVLVIQIQISQCVWVIITL